MLPSKHLVRNGRYSIDRSICKGSAGTIYIATDTLRNATVAIIERSDTSAANDPGSGLFARTQHDGLVRIGDDFEETSCRYSATEPILTATVKPPEDGSLCQAIFDRFGAILLAINAKRDDLDLDSASGVDISPELFVLSAEGKLKLLYPGSAGFAGIEPAVTSPFAPLESVWESLDHITQKAIYNSYDETSLTLLESPADAASDVYTLGAIFYKILTGKDPVPAVERSIEMLDSNADPLRSLSSLNPAVSPDQSKFIERMLEVRRERRFGSIEDALFSLPSPPQATKARLESVVPEPEDFPLLELPSAPMGIPLTASANAFLPRQEFQVLETTPVDSAAAFRPPFAVGEAVIETMPESVAVEPEQEIQPKAEIKPEPRPEPQEVFTAFESAQPAGGGAMKFVAICAGALVVTVGLGWAVLSGSSAKQADPSASMAAPPTVVQEQQQSAPSEPAQTTVAEPVGVSVDTDENANSAQSAKPKPQIADTRAAPPKAAKPAAKNEPKPAKKLTVDDLIN
jgi:serine/threonine protein kinase